MRGVLAAVTPPPHWRTQRLDAAVERRKVNAHPDLEPLSVFTGLGVVPRASQDWSYKALGESLVDYLLVEPGDIVFNKLRTWQGAIGLSHHRGIVSPAYFVCRPRAHIDARFLHYVLRSSPWVQEIRRVSKWMPPNQNDIAWDDLKKVEIPIPPLSEQRAIAWFLDEETARIDALIENKRRILRLLDERLHVLVTAELFGSNAPWVRVGRAVDLLAGHAFSSDSFSTDAGSGIRLLRGINVAPGRVRWDECVYVETEMAEEAARFSLAVGDLVIGMDRPVISGGMRVAEITEADVPCLLVQRVARLRVNDLAERDWIRLALMSPAFVAYFSPIVTGVSVPHISPGQIASFKLPLPEREVQRSILRRLLKVEEMSKELNDAAAAQIALLREHRQAIITAAVTGKVDLVKAAA